ncbi:MAG TPA: hypothetical protein VGB26_12930 [Nitrospiria bacterium]|jgi:hypothetical protein
MTSKFSPFSTPGFGEGFVSDPFAEKIPKAIIETTSGFIGDEFFRTLVKNLASLLEVRWGFISEVSDIEGKKVRLITIWSGSEHGHPFEYETKGTPCEHVVARNLAFFPSRGPRIISFRPMVKESSSGRLFGHPSQ